MRAMFSSAGLRSSSCRRSSWSGSSWFRPIITASGTPLSRDRPGRGRRCGNSCRRLENIMLLQLRVGVLFPLFLFIGLRARRTDAGLHKRMMILATAIPLGAAIDRMKWLPTTLPDSPLATDLYIFLAVAPMFAWDLIRNRSGPSRLADLDRNQPSGRGDRARPVGHGLVASDSAEIDGRLSASGRHGIRKRGMQ